MTSHAPWRRLALLTLAAAAAVNLAAGATIAIRDPARASDLLVMYEWCRAWAIDGRSLYTGADASTDYPPNAIVLLSPLAFAPLRWLVPLWTIVGLALAPVLPWLVMRAAAPRRHAAGVLAVPVLLYLCWAAPRTLLQFSVMAMALACAALLLADTRRWTAGIALGLALLKPHISGPIALWMIVSGRIQPVIVALGLAAVGWAVYDVRIGESPWTTANGLWHVLGGEYTGVHGLVGRTSIRAVARAMTNDPAAADAIWLASSALLLLAVGALTLRDRARPLTEGGMAAPALFCLWSLLVTYHNGNNLLLMLPAFAVLWFHAERRRAAREWLPIVALQAALMFDVPVRLAGVAARSAWSQIAIEHFDRLVVVAALAQVSAVWWRQTKRHADRDGVAVRHDDESASTGGAVARAAPSPR